MSRSSWGATILEVVEHRTVERRGSPACAQLWAHVGCRIRTGIGPTETPGVLLPIVGRYTERAVVGGHFSGGGGRDGGASSKGEPWRH